MNGWPQNGMLHNTTDVKSCIVEPINWTPWIQPATVPVPMVVPVVMPGHTHYHFTPVPLSDADVDRIAKRVAEILKAG